MSPAIAARRALRKAIATGAPCRPSISAREFALVAVLHRIVIETMDFPPTKAVSACSYLPGEMLEQAQKTLSLFGLRVREVRS